MISVTVYIMNYTQNQPEPASVELTLTFFFPDIPHSGSFYARLTVTVKGKKITIHLTQ